MTKVVISNETLLATLILDFASQVIENANTNIELFCNIKESEEYKRAEINLKNTEQIEDVIETVFGTDVLEEARKVFKG